MSASIISWKFWDMWLQKIFVQMISVKVLSLGTSVVLCVLGFISGGNLTAIFATIFGVKGIFQVANIFNKNGRNQDIIDKV